MDGWKEGTKTMTASGLRLGMMEEGASTGGGHGEREKKVNWIWVNCDHGRQGSR